MFPLQTDFLGFDLAVLVPTRLDSSQSFALDLDVADAHDGTAVVNGPVYCRASQSS